MFPSLKYLNVKGYNQYCNNIKTPFRAQTKKYIIDSAVAENIH